MKKHRIYVLVFVCVALVVGTGLRIGTGQGYSDPIVLPAGAKTNAAALQRTLEVRLTNRKTGRPQHYRWSLSMTPGGSVEIECHEWRLASFFGRPMFGWPRNSFRRVVLLDAEEEDVTGPYHFVIRWNEKNAEP